MCGSPSSSRPSLLHKRSNSSPDPSILLLSHLSVNAQHPADHMKSKTPSPTRRRLMKRHSAAFAVKMDVDGTQNGIQKEVHRKVHTNEVVRPPLHTQLSAPPRLNLFSKRHPSNSPREVSVTPPSLIRQYSQPLRFKSLGGHSPVSPDGSDELEDESRSGSSFQTTPSPPTSGSSPISSQPDTSRGRAIRSKPIPTSPTKGNGSSADAPSSSRNRRTSSSRSPTLSKHLPQLQPLTGEPVFPFSRPYSLPEAHSSPFGSVQETIQSPTPVRGTWPDRTSSASMPLPLQMPYFTLPKSLPEASMRQGQQARPGKSTHSSHTTAATYEMDAMTRGLLLDPHDPSPPSMLRSTSSTLCGTSTTIRPVSDGDLQSRMYPAPEPPTILTPPPPPDANEGSRAPYEPFLSNAPPPEDSWIMIETSATEYRLIIRLPGYDRDAITLATRRRRILHVVADSWTQGGGHFERRISFGYDADLASVRAEFNGEILTVIIPRRIAPMISLDVNKTG